VGAALAATVLLAVLALRASPLPGVEVAWELPYAGAATLDVYAPAHGHGRPVLVMLHGCCGAKEDLSQLAWEAAAAGAVVYNVTWLNLQRGGGYPTAYQQAACAVRFARATATRHGGAASRVTLLGWSDGAMLAAVVANAGDDFGGDCLARGHSALPDAVVGVGGFYGWPVAAGGGIDARYVTPRTARFFGGSPARAPAAWAAGNPYTQLGRNRRVGVALIVDANDPLVDDNRRFLAALRRARHRATLTVVAGGDPLTLISPRTDQGRATLQATLRVAAGQAPDGRS
jgi:acetyl esterase/lipase